MKYERIVSYICERPWAIREEKLQAIAELIALRANGLTLTPREIEARIGERQEASEPSRAGGGIIAVVPVMGVLSHRMNLFSEYSGGTSTERLARVIREAASDESVETIVLDIDSEGGMVEGIPELWQEIYQARAKKKIVAVVNAMAASAAYYIASAADEIVATPSGSVGSIGVLHIHMEESKAIEDSGVTVTITRAGKHKGEGNPFEPLADAAKEHIQKRVDEAYGMFVRDVAKGRGVKVSDVRNGFGQGHVVSAQEGKELGMVDRIESLDATLSRLIGKRGKRSMVSFAIASRDEDGERRWAITDEQGTVLVAGPLHTASGLEFAGIEHVLFAGVVPKSRSNEWADEDESWEAPTLKDYTDKPWEELSDAEKRKISSDFVWAPKMPPDRFSDLKGPHHRPSDGKVVWRGLSALAARFNQMDIPAEDKPVAKRHLRGHYRDGGKDIPDILKEEEQAGKPVATGQFQRRNALNRDIEILELDTSS